MTPKTVIAKMQDGESITINDFITVITPVWRKINIDIDYNNEAENSIHIHTTNTKTIGNYSGWSFQKTDKDNPMIFINTDRSLPEQIQTIAHETGHIIMQRASRQYTTKRIAEKKAYAVERCFINAFNEIYDTIISVKKQKLKYITNNIKLEYNY